MRSRLVIAALGLVAVIGLLVGVSGAARAPKQYQWTGIVTDVSAADKLLAIQKEGETNAWEFSTEGLKDPGVKKGDKVTVYYISIAKKIEKK
jgi:hypothetical protein